MAHSYGVHNIIYTHHLMIKGTNVRDWRNDTCRFSLYFHIARNVQHNHCRSSRDATDFSKDWIQWNYRARAEVTRVATFAQTFPQGLQTSHVGWHKRDADFSMISARHRLFGIVWRARSKNICLYIFLSFYSRREQHFENEAREDVEFTRRHSNFREISYS